jgi:hypothetical protein
MMAAAVVGPWYAVVYLAVSPLIAGLPPARQAHESLTHPLRMFILPLSLVVGYLVPAILMGLSSPKLVSNDFRQMAIVSWNVFPILVSLIQTVLSSLCVVLGLSTKDASSPFDHLNAIRFANACALIVSTTSHIAIVSLSAITVVFPFVFEPEYVKEFSPRAVMAPPIFSTAVSSLGQGVRTFMLWDQIFAYGTMLILAGLQLHPVISVSMRTFRPIWTAVFVAFCALVAGPGSACLALNWMQDELLFGSELGLKGSTEIKRRQ